MVNGICHNLILIYHRLRDAHTNTHPLPFVGFPGWLTPEQEKALVDFREKSLKEGMFTKNTLMEDKHLLRYLRARDFDLKKTFDMLSADLEWRKSFEGCTFKKADFPEIMKFADSGALYRGGVDKDGRPVLVAKLSKIFPRDIADLNELPRFWVSYVHALNDECEKAGTTDYTIIADLAGFSPSKNFSLVMVKILIDILQKYYPERLAYALVLNTPMAFRMLWNMIAPFLEERTKAKVHILGSSMKLLLDYVPADQLEPEYGGTHKTYQLPDHIATRFLHEGITVNTGYFEASQLASGDAAAPDGPSPAEKKAAVKRSMSKASLAKVRAVLGTMKGKSTVTAIQVPKSSPRVTVFGATGKTGQEVVKRALSAGYDVCAFVRTDGSGIPATFLQLQKQNGIDKLQIVIGDIHDERDLDRAIETSDAVISCVGAPRSMTQDSMFFETTAERIVESMERNGTRRLIVVTAAQAKRMSKAWYDANASITENGARMAFWSTHYSHIAALEKYVESKKDTIDYTFVRPSQLDEVSTSESYQAEPDTFFIGGGPLPRPALAQFIVQDCVAKNKYIGQGVAMAAKE